MIVVYSFYLIFGFYLFLNIFKRQKKFLELSVISIIFGSGPMIFGYPLLDEYLIIMLLTAVYIKSSIKNNISIININNRSDLKFHNFMFYLLIICFLINSFRGMLVLDDLRMIRWILFFIILGFVSYIFCNFRYLVNQKYLIKVVFYSSNFYFIVYFLHGLFFEIFLDLNKHDIQGNLWIGTSTAALPLIIYGTSLIFFWENYKSKKTLFNIMLSLTLVFSCSIFYSSRISLIILSFIAFYTFLILLKNKKIFIFLIPFMMTSVFLIIFSNNHLKNDIKKYIPYDFKNNQISMPEKFNPKSADLDRIIEPKAAILTINNESGKLFFGHGWYVARIVMLDIFNDLRSEAGLSEIEGKIHQPSAISAILVDTGILGFLLFIINLFLCLVKIIKQSNHKIFVSTMLLFLPLLFFVGNITPLLLTYFLIMPNNPILSMTKNKSLNY